MNVRVITDGIQFTVGDKPKPTPFEITDELGALDTADASATITAKVTNNALAPVTVTCTNNGDGTGSIDWPATSVFVEKGAVLVEMRAVDGAYDEVIAVFTLPVR